MSPSALVAHFGSQTAAARAIGTRQSTVSDWVRADHIPFVRQKQIEEVTGGALVADADAWKLELPPPVTIAEQSAT